jgi:hypothetical protein
MTSPGPVAFALGALALAGAACGSQRAAGDDTAGDDDDDVTHDAGPEAPDARRPDLVKFVVMGDTGEGNTDQRAVGERIRDVCAADGCDFVLLLGDNIYDDGVASVDDPQWQTKFEEPYRDIDLPFWAVLGNHDYGGDVIGINAPGIGNEWDKGPIEVQYTERSAKWRMPDTHYTLTVGHVGFIMLDTNSLMWGDTTHGDQAMWLPTALEEVAGARWVFVAGHHPYRSNGTHGNAGNYDAPEVLGLPLPNPIPLLNGGNVKSWFEEHLCGIGDVYFSGHDHSRQWLNEPTALCGTEMIISGAGAKVTDIMARGNVAYYEDATEAGFMYVVVDGDTFSAKFYDAAGNVDFERTFTKP